MKVTAHQIPLLPWGGFWGKAMVARHLILMADMPVTSTDHLTDFNIGGTRISLSLGKERKEMASALVTHHSVMKLRKTVEQQIINKKSPGYAYMKEGWDRLTYVLDSLYGNNDVHLQTLNCGLMDMVCKWLDQTTNPVDFTMVRYPRYPEDKVDYPYGVPNAIKTKRLMSYLDNAVNGRTENQEGLVYLSGGGGSNYLVPEYIPDHVSVHLQVILPNMPPGTFLQTLASVAHPQEAVNKVLQAQEWTLFKRAKASK